MQNNLLSLLQLSDPALPIGGYAHSAGLETYVQQGIVKDIRSAGEFVIAMLEENLQYNDAAFVSLAWSAAKENNVAKLLLLNDQCTAVKLAREIREASHKLGNRLMKLFHSMTATGLVDEYKTCLEKSNSSGNYCIAFGLFAAVLGISKVNSLHGFYYNAASGIVTNAVKLVPLSQQQGQQLLFSLQRLIETLVTNTVNPDENKIGRSCAAFDIHSMQHEFLYSRLYMS